MEVPLYHKLITITSNPFYEKVFKMVNEVLRLRLRKL
jgi:hypothetical protein